MFRPKPSDNEEDILKQQEEFLKSRKNNPSVHLINKRKPESDLPGVSNPKVSQDGPNKKNKSIFAVRKNKAPKHEDQNIQETIHVLGEIKEKTYEKNISITAPSSTIERGFPEAFVRDKMSKPRGRSIFAQQFSKDEMPASDTEENLMICPEKKNTIAKNTFGTKSFIISGSDAECVHEENLLKLSKMTEEEITSERMKLLSQLDPKLVQFIKSKREANGGQTAKPTSSIDEKIKTESNTLAMEVDKGNNSLETLEFLDSKKKNDNFVDDQTQDITLEDSIPLVSELSNKWLHMDVIEIEKLKWTAKLPDPPAIQTDQSYSARFDFEGMILPYVDDNLDVTKGLHHHGEEPSRPGYTLQELFQLTRSSVLQQRVLSLSTIANIIEKTKSGYYDRCLNEPLLEVMIQTDLFLLLRFSLDENMDTVLLATLQAIRNLLWNHPDEVCLDRMMGCFRGIEQPSLEVKIEVKPEKKKEAEDEEKELKDYQITKLDVIKGALRTDIILRLRYILEVLKPAPKAVIAVLEILTRIVRHSEESALAVTCCPRLLQIITTNFTPKDWRSIVGGKKPEDMASVYGVPLVSALKLLRIIACRSRMMASDLVQKFEIAQSLASYISVDPRECSLPQQEALRLSLECMYLWQSLLAYNLTTQQFIDMYPVIMRLLQFHISSTDINDNSSTFGHEHGAALLSLLEQVVTVAYKQRGCRVSSTLSLEHLNGYIQPLETCAIKWLSQLQRTVEPTFSSLKLLAANMNCLAACYSCHCCLPNIDLVGRLEQIELLFNKHLLSFLKSPTYNFLTSLIRQSSCLLYDGQLGALRDPESLPSLGGLVWGGDVTPVLRPESPIHLFQALSNVITEALTLHKGLDHEIWTSFCNNNVMGYVSAITSNDLNMTNHWFTRIELFFLHSLLTVFSLQGSVNSNVFHLLAIRMVSLTYSSNKISLKKTLNVIFSQDIFMNCYNIEFGLKTLRLSDDFQGNSSKHAALKAAIENIKPVQECYEEALKVKTYSEALPFEMKNLTSNFDTLVPNDWFFIPILSLHSQESSGKSASHEDITTVVKSLQWILLMECLCPSAISSISVTARYSRLCTVFLAASDLFLDSTVSQLLDLILQQLLNYNNEINFKKDIPGLSSFYDLYSELLEQFAAVSYGSRVFGQFIIVPLQQRHSSDFRKLLWSEQAAVLRVLSVPLNELRIPLKDLLEPCETDQSLLSTYLHCLATGTVQNNWSPVLYQVALHHVATFIKTTDSNVGLVQQLKEKIKKLGNKALQSKILTYEDCF